MIRPASHDDMGQLLSLSVEMHAESRYAVLPFSPEKVRSLFAGLITSPSGFLHVVESEGNVVGFMAAFVVEHFCSSAKVAGDYGLFITKAQRGGVKAVRLLKAFQCWASEQGVELIHTGITTGVSVEATARLYSSLGKQVGIVFELEKT